MSNSPLQKMPLVQIHGVDEIRIDSVPRPVAGADDIVVEVAHCGICGSDLGYIAMGGLLGPGTPMPLGHELSGTVIEAGSNVDHVRVGDRVVVNPEANENRIGNSGAEGAFSPYLLVRGASRDPECAIKIPDSLSFEHGAMVEPLSVAMHAVHQGQISADNNRKKAVIFGAGPIGLGALLVMKYYGVQDIAVIDLDDNRLALAEKLGATAINGRDSDIAQQLIALHGEATLMAMPVPATDVFFEATGAGPVFKQIVGLAKMAARVVVVGVHKTPIELHLVDVLIRELTIVGSMAYPKEFPLVLDMLATGAVDCTALISHRYPLSEFKTAVDTAKNPAKAMKVMIDCQR